VTFSTVFESLKFCQRFFLTLSFHSTFPLPMLVVWFGWFLGPGANSGKRRSTSAKRSAASRQNLRRDIELRPEPGPRTKTTHTNGAASPLLNGKLNTSAGSRSLLASRVEITTGNKNFARQSGDVLFSVGQRRVQICTRSKQGEQRYMTITQKIERLEQFGEQLLRRYHAKCVADLPRGPQEDYRRLAERYGINPSYKGLGDLRLLPEQQGCVGNLGGRESEPMNTEMLQGEADARNLAAIDHAPKGVLLESYFVVRKNVLLEVPRENLTFDELRYILEMCRQLGTELLAVAVPADAARYEN